jgi:hypothetical protein
MEEKHIEVYVKYNLYYAEKQKGFKENISISQNLYYNEKEDYFVYPMGQHMEYVGRTTRTNEIQQTIHSGFDTLAKIW